MRVVSRQLEHHGAAARRAAERSAIENQMRNFGLSRKLNFELKRRRTSRTGLFISVVCEPAPVSFWLQVPRYGNWGHPHVRSFACGNATLRCYKARARRSCQTQQCCARSRSSSSWKGKLCCFVFENTERVDGLARLELARLFQSRAPFSQGGFRGRRGPALCFVVAVRFFLGHGTVGQGKDSSHIHRRRTP